MGSPHAIRQVLVVLADNWKHNVPMAVVCSAFSKVTDALIDLAKTAFRGDASYKSKAANLHRRHVDMAEALLDGEELAAVHHGWSHHFSDLENVLQGVFLIREITPRTLDLIMSFGERNSAVLLAAVLRQAGIPAEYLDMRQLIRTDNQFGHAKVDFLQTDQLISEFFKKHRGVIQVATGFIGSTAEGLTTTLGRGGSDYTASIIGAALGAEAIEIWTDVDGVMTADPRRVKKAFSLPVVTYREAMEMSHFGAKVIYPPTIQPAMGKGIPLFIRNTFNLAHIGTMVGDHVSTTHILENPADHVGASSISSINEISLLTLQGSGLFGVPGSASRLFSALARAGVNIVLITQASSESSITFAVAPHEAAQAHTAAEREFQMEIREGLVEPLREEKDLAVVALVGENMRYRPGIAGRLFEALGKNGVNVVAIAQGSSELNISVVIEAKDENKALNAIHDAFFLSESKTLHLFLVGTGSIGRTLIRQIRDQQEFLQEKRRLEIKVAGLANSRKMWFGETGAELAGDWQAQLNAGESYTSTAFLDRMNAMNLPNSIFIDCTASAEVANLYEKVLSHSISISTPNKLAASGPYEHYFRLKNLANRRNVRWCFETNVGAGLPIISTLNDLIHSGDQILRIEGVFSGTLSYIFNHFNGKKPFAAIVREAQSLGLTEPDPRDDLNGADVRRKLLILAREAGWPLEMEDIKMENFLPPSCLEVQTVEAFYHELEKHDDTLTERLKNAGGKALRCVATLDRGKASFGLQEYDESHPFYFLSGSDNMVVFTTERYRERPLVVRGPGAGAEVTAAGVFAEFIRIGNEL